ncbi:MAG TPA: hypothetical protein VFS60_16545, partial [Thermoanaerobaculia bacterium]|nr:hypothetical protein [Thermoanaerobaculia bacterium]
MLLAHRHGVVFAFEPVAALGAREQRRAEVVEQLGRLGVGGDRPGERLDAAFDAPAERLRGADGAQLVGVRRLRCGAAELRGREVAHRAARQVEADLVAAVPHRGGRPRDAAGEAAAERPLARHHRGEQGARVAAGQPPAEREADGDPGDPDGRGDGGGERRRAQPLSPPLTARRGARLSRFLARQLADDGDDLVLRLVALGLLADRGADLAQG